MSSLTYHNYDGYGKYAHDVFQYSQAVRIGDRIEISGQGGWDPKSAPPVLKPDVEHQIDQTFKNIDLTLKTAGGKGLSQVYSIRTYQPNLSKTPETFEILVKKVAEYFPDHKPIWTALGVESLAMPEMLIEIEAVAYDPKE
ncbi:hypothetical protein Sste5346_006024 [Sporothrix stenoceras]|uniref:Uncharacterized protein n=1 Tax=Sporothrix stenoceras TaxID=5173 RepID=A0ABR3Z2H8_9PEZI